MKSSQIASNLSEASSACVHPTDFVAFLPWACRQLMAPFQVVVVREEVKKVEEPSSKSMKPKTRLSAQPVSVNARKESELSAEDEFTIVLTAVYNASDLVEICLARCKQIPQLLFKIIALCIPFNSSLQKFTIRWSQPEGAAFYEISKFLPHSTITEICLDDSISYEAKYDLLLQTPHLKTLSLARCRVGDLVCGNIVSQLEHTKPSSKGLVGLNLTSNMITDVGAEKIGLALRRNRQLRYLNLSGNLITDEGVAHILWSLMEFPLTEDEVIGKRMRRISHLTSWLKAYEGYIDQLKAEVGNERSDKENPKGIITAKDESKKMPRLQDSNRTKARTMANDIVGIYEDPYSNEETVCKDDWVYCIGNLSLCCLNLAYNNLEYPTVVKLCEVLGYQNKLASKQHSGLIRVVIEGNNLPKSCCELESARQFLDVALETWTKTGQSNETKK